MNAETASLALSAFALLLSGLMFLLGRGIVFRAMELAFGYGEFKAEVAHLARQIEEIKTNHLAHMVEKIDSVATRQEDLKSQLADTLARVRHIEGHIEGGRPFTVVP